MKTMEDSAEDLDPSTYGTWAWELAGFVFGRIGKVPPIDYGPDTSPAPDEDLDRQVVKWFGEGMIPEEASERTILLMSQLGLLRPAREFFVVPEPPRRPDGRSMGFDPSRAGGFYRVFHDADLIAAYNAVYFYSVDEVLVDLIDRIRAEGDKRSGRDDFAVWRDGRLLAAIHGPVDGDDKKIVRFTEERNDPGGTDHRCLPGWPTRGQWIESGRGSLWFDRLNPENPAA